MVGESISVAAPGTISSIAITNTPTAPTLSIEKQVDAIPLQITSTKKPVEADATSLQITSKKTAENKSINIVDKNASSGTIEEYNAKIKEDNEKVAASTASYDAVVNKVAGVFNKANADNKSLSQDEVVAQLKLIYEAALAKQAADKEVANDSLNDYNFSLVNQAYTSLLLQGGTTDTRNVSLGMTSSDKEKLAESTKTYEAAVKAANAITLPPLRTQAIHDAAEKKYESDLKLGNLKLNAYNQMLIDNAALKTEDVTTKTKAVYDDFQKQVTVDEADQVVVDKSLDTYNAALAKAKADYVDDPEKRVEAILVAAKAKQEADSKIKNDALNAVNEQLIKDVLESKKDTLAQVVENARIEKLQNDPDTGSVTLYNKAIVSANSISDPVARLNAYIEAATTKSKSDIVNNIKDGYVLNLNENLISGATGMLNQYMGLKSTYDSNVSLVNDLNSKLTKPVTEDVGKNIESLIDSYRSGSKNDEDFKTLKTALYNIMASGDAGSSTIYNKAIQNISDEEKIGKQTPITQDQEERILVDFDTGKEYTGLKLEKIIDASRPLKLNEVSGEWEFNKWAVPDPTQIKDPETGKVMTLVWPHSFSGNQVVTDYVRDKDDKIILTQGAYNVVSGKGVTNTGSTLQSIMTNNQIKRPIVEAIIAENAKIRDETREHSSIISGVAAAAAQAKLDYDTKYIKDAKSYDNILSEIYGLSSGGSDILLNTDKLLSDTAINNKIVLDTSMSNEKILKGTTSAYNAAVKAAVDEFNLTDKTDASILFSKLYKALAIKHDTEVGNVAAGGAYSINVGVKDFDYYVDEDGDGEDEHIFNTDLTQAMENYTALKDNLDSLKIAYETNLKTYKDSVAADPNSKMKFETSGMFFNKAMDDLKDPVAGALPTWKYDTKTTVDKLLEMANLKLCQDEGRCMTGGDITGKLITVQKWVDPKSGEVKDYATITVKDYDNYLIDQMSKIKNTYDTEVSNITGYNNKIASGISNFNTEVSRQLITPPKTSNDAVENARLLLDAAFKKYENDDPIPDKYFDMVDPVGASGSTPINSLENFDRGLILSMADRYEKVKIDAPATETISNIVKNLVTTTNEYNAKAQLDDRVGTLPYQKSDFYQDLHRHELNNIVNDINKIESTKSDWSEIPELVKKYNLISSNLYQLLRVAPVDASSKEMDEINDILGNIVGHKDIFSPKSQTIVKNPESTVVVSQATTQTIPAHDEWVKSGYTGNIKVKDASWDATGVVYPNVAGKGAPSGSSTLRYEPVYGKLPAGVGGAAPPITGWKEVKLTLPVFATGWIDTSHNEHHDAQTITIPAVTKTIPAVYSTSYPPIQNSTSLTSKLLGNYGSLTQIGESDKNKSLASASKILVDTNAVSKVASKDTSVASTMGEHVKYIDTIGSSKIPEIGKFSTISDVSKSISAPDLTGGKITATQSFKAPEISTNVNITKLDAGGFVNMIGPTPLTQITGLISSSPKQISEPVVIDRTFDINSFYNPLSKVGEWDDKSQIKSPGFYDYSQFAGSYVQADASKNPISTPSMGGVGIGDISNMNSIVSFYTGFDDIGRNILPADAPSFSVNPSIGSYIKNPLSLNLQTSLSFAASFNPGSYLKPTSNEEYTGSRRSIGWGATDISSSRLAGGGYWEAGHFSTKVLNPLAGLKVGQIKVDKFNHMLDDIPDITQKSGTIKIQRKRNGKKKIVVKRQASYSIPRVNLPQVGIIKQSAKPIAKIHRVEKAQQQPVSKAKTYKMPDIVNTFGSIKMPNMGKMQDVNFRFDGKKKSKKR